MYNYVIGTFLTGLVRQPNEKAINQVADPGALSVVAHLEEPVREAKVPTVAAVFPYQVRQK